MLYYTGIGSRETPSEVTKTMFKLGVYLSRAGFILRSGGARGADDAFEKGCLSIKGDMEIYLPNHRFNGRTSDNSLYFDTDTFDNKSEAHAIAASIIPYWSGLNEVFQKLHGRNPYQVLGRDLNTPSRLVICYSKPTALKRVSGGTNTAVVLAHRWGIPVFNLHDPITLTLIECLLKKYLDIHRMENPDLR